MPEPWLPTTLALKQGTPLAWSLLGVEARSALGAARAAPLCSTLAAAWARHAHTAAVPAEPRPQSPPLPTRRAAMEPSDEFGVL